jgi:hypothetical protein
MPGITNPNLFSMKALGQLAKNGIDQIALGLNQRGQACFFRLADLSSVNQNKPWLTPFSFI